MSQDPILVTGASGFLASHIVLRLLASGRAVRGSVRNAAKGAHIREVLARHGADLGRFSLVELDLMSDEGWREAMDGAGALIHAASPFVTTIPDNEDEIIRPAVDGARRALHSALEAGVERIVFTSSEVAVARGHSKARMAKPFTEADWSNVDGPGMTPYFKSKTLAEQEAWRIMDRAGRRAALSVINPGFILGPLLEDDVGTSGAIVQKMLRGELPGAPNIYFSVIDVRDAADLHIAALDDPRAAGRRVFSSCHPISFKEMALMLAEAFPAYAGKLPTRGLPDVMVRFMGLFNADARSSGRLLGAIALLDSALAQELLGRELIEAREAVIATGLSLIDQGLA